VTGAPIYLVSACASGEEFAAAFRRYADKNGLFVPIREPLPAGTRSRFAVALKDGGVMIEGEAEILSSAPTPSSLHGRIGMTLRFLEPDHASKTVLDELVRARLSMRPPPPSVPPRRAEIPAEPRPVPPPVQGRIDAVNALAECVVVRDTSALVPPAAPAPTVAPPKAGPKPFAPGVPAASSLGTASRAAPSPPAAPPDPPAISGFSRTMTAVKPLLDPGPTSDTLVAATPPEPPPTLPESPGLLPEPSGLPPPEPPAPPLRESPAAARSEPPGVPPPEPFTTTLVGTSVAPSIAAPPTQPRHAIEMQAVLPQTITEPHALVAPAAPTPAPAAPAPAAADPAGSAPAVPAPAAPTPAAPASAALGPPPLPPPPVELVRTGTDSITMTAVPVPSATSSATTDPGGVVVGPLPPIDNLDPAPSPDDTSARTQVHAGAPRPEPAAASLLGSSDENLDPSHVSTFIGTPPIPRVAPPASPLPAVLTPAPPIVPPARPGFPEIEIAEPTEISPGPPEPPPAEDIKATVPEIPRLRQRKTVLGVVVAPSGAPVLPASASVRPAAPARLPSGNWAIALDPQAPDGWSEPFALVLPEHLAGAPKRPTPPLPPTSPSGEPPVSEPKVQIDPTLIAPPGPVASNPPLKPMPPEASLPPPMNMAPVPQEVPFLGPHGPSVTHSDPVPDYPMNPSYQMVPMADLSAPELPSPGSSGLETPRYASETTLPAQTRRHVLVIVLLSALLIVVTGIVVLAVLRTRQHTGAPAGEDVESPHVPPAEPRKAPAITPAPTPAAPKDPAESSAAAPG
jgi:hypothetical protein